MFSSRSKSSSLFFAFVDDQLALFLGRRVGVLDLDRLFGQVGVFLVQLQDRDSPASPARCVPASAMIGNCRISIDWIIRGASTCF